MTVNTVHATSVCPWMLPKQPAHNSRQLQPRSDRASRRRPSKPPTHSASTQNTQEHSPGGHSRARASALGPRPPLLLLLGPAAAARPFLLLVALLWVVTPSHTCPPPTALRAPSQVVVLLLAVNPAAAVPLPSHPPRAAL